VGKQTDVNIVLEVDIAGLNDVVVVGYGTQKKSDLTGSISTISAKDIEGRQTVLVSDALQGSIPGVAVTRNNGAPGSSSTITFRGITTIGNNNPLIIIDGVSASNIDEVNPSDIETITVLKDAASAAIYGSRAAAGVILVTTKRAKDGQSNLDYNYEYGIQKPTALPEYVDIVRYFRLFNEFVMNDGGTPLYTDDYINNYLANHQENPDLYPNTNWQDVILKDYAPRESHNLTFTSGTTKLKTEASLNYSKSDGLYNHRSYDRYTARINNDLKINEMLDVKIDVSFNRQHYLSPAGNSNPFSTARIIPSYYSAKYLDGRWGLGKDGINPLAQVYDGGIDQSYYNSLTGRFLLNFKPVKNLIFTVLFSPNFDFDKVKSFSKVIKYTNLTDPSIIVDQNQPNTILIENRNEGRSLNGQFLVNYSKTINHNNNIEALLGYEEIYNSNDNLSATRGAFELTNFPYLNAGSPSMEFNSGTASESALRSFFGRLQYNFREKYYLQGNIRRDGSSRFAPGYKWSTFPSASVGWIASKENFMKNAESLSFLKLRGSWGMVGNERIGNYPYQASILFNNALFYQGSAIIAATSGAQSVLAVPNITWETTESYDIGVDLAFFQNRLNSTFDYFSKTTKQILLNLSIPSYLGYQSPNQNSGIVNAKGWEFEANWRDRVGKYRYSISFNIADSKTKDIDLKGTKIITGNTANIEGGEFNEWYGYKSHGLFQTKDEISHSALLDATTQPGDIKYIDINGDGKITPDDKVLLKGSLPRYIYGINFRIEYKGFDFGLTAQGVAKQTSLLNSVMIRPISGGYGTIPKIIDGNFWSVNNSEKQNLGAIYPRLSQKSSSSNYQMSDFWLINGSYFRLKNLTVGYTIPSSLSVKAKLKGIRVYVTANDLFSLNNFPSGWDPEVDATTYPIVRTIMAGINIQF
jgi:TonB-linked SusC/RagA family outer membrane protein